MVDQKLTTFFNKIYDETYRKTLLYVTSKCGDTNDISDIVQEIYTELYSVIIKKGFDYIENTEAFVMQVSKSKIYKHYSLAQKLKNVIPLYFKDEEDQEVNIVDSVLLNNVIEDNLINKSLTEEIWNFISTKPNEVKKIFYLYYYNDLTIQEISKELSISQSNVKNKLYRTAKEIRSIYGKDGVSNE